MQTRFVEAGNGFNWGKFVLARFAGEEWRQPSAMPDAFATPLVRSQGWGPDHVLILDLATGEGAIFLPGGYAKADLDKHQIWVCPLFEPFLTWLYRHVSDLRETWWEDLPPLVELPDAPPALTGYRRPGPNVRL